MVGSKNNGDMQDNDVEAHSGDIIDQVRVAAENSYHFNPNVVTINAGTNDCTGNINIPNAGARMQNLIQTILGQPGWDKTTIILSTLIPSANGATEAPRGSVNDQYRNLVKDMQADGVRIVLADMAPPGTGNGWLSYPADYGDPVHPNDQGYAKMAYVWWAAINRARNDGLLQPPNISEIDEGCHKKPGDGVSAGGLTQQVNGLDDGIYYHSSVGMGSVFDFSSNFDRGQWFFAKLFSRDLDNLVGWVDQPDGTVVYAVYKNNGGDFPRFTKIDDMSVHDNCLISGVNFVDINGDGLDDFVCIAKNGEAFASISNGPSSGSPPTFTPIGSIKGSEPGYDQPNIRLADIDGDGRADYCASNAGGDISCWRNGGIRELGDGLNVAWRQGFLSGSSSGPTHAGMGVAGIRDRIHFARIYGESEAFGLLGRHDYVYMEHTKNGDKYDIQVKVWKNVGSGSTKLKADGDKYCNMMGHSGGREDYVWTLSTGQITIYPNAGLSEVGDGQSFWGPETIMFDPEIHAGGRNLDRRDLHLADWDGDGFCDIIWTNPNENNQVEVWRNRYGETQAWNWSYLGNPATELSCVEKRGLGIHDIPVHFADVTGNNKADYLCMQKDGRTTGWVNGDSGWEAIDQFKHTEGLDRANFQFADADGDGKADLIWTDKFSGEGTVYYNGGRQEVGGSQFLWTNEGKAFTGNAAGTCVYYPDLNGDSRADQHNIIGTFINEARTWFNTCVGGNAMGDDPSTGTDPQLSAMPGLDPDGV
ncbi:hypothetical protein VF21_08567 [Pseudogymnoascus sp. 05NY08]|nr:hypothetical protein VF21_08567 [Pseudogymnoascus sp. 05NY08]